MNTKEVQSHKKNKKSIIPKQNKKNNINFF